MARLVGFCSIGKKPFSDGLIDQLFRLEKCSIEKRQSHQPKPVVVETVDPNKKTT